jgi:hypothetical protein
LNAYPYTTSLISDLDRRTRLQDTGTATARAATIVEEVEYRASCMTIVHQEDLGRLEELRSLHYTTKPWLHLLLQTDNTQKVG